MKLPYVFLHLNADEWTLRESGGDIFLLENSRASWAFMPLAESPDIDVRIELHRFDEELPRMTQRVRDLVNERWRADDPEAASDILLLTFEGVITQSQARLQTFWQIALSGLSEWRLNWALVNSRRSAIGIIDRAYVAATEHVRAWIGLVDTGLGRDTFATVWVWCEACPQVQCLIVGGDTLSEVIFFEDLAVVLTGYRCRCLKHNPADAEHH